MRAFLDCLGVCLLAFAASSAWANGPAAACKPPRPPLAQMEGVFIEQFNTQSRPDQRLAVIQAAVQDLFSCYPEKLAQPWGKPSEDSRPLFQSWLTEVSKAWAQDPQGVLAKVAPQQRAGFKAAWLATAKTLGAYESLGIKLAKHENVADFCSSVMDVGRRAGLDAGAARRYASDYRAFYYPLFRNAPDYAADKRYAPIDQRCNVEPFFGRAGLDAASSIDAVFGRAGQALPSLAVNFDGTRALNAPASGERDLASTTVDSRGRVIKTYDAKSPQNFYDPSTRSWRPNREIGEQSREQALQLALGWQRRCEKVDGATPLGKSAAEEWLLRKPEVAAKGFARFGCDLWAGVMSIPAAVLMPSDKEGFYVTLTKLSEGDADAWKSLPAGAFDAVFGGIRRGIENLEKNPSGANILHLGLAIELTAASAKVPLESLDDAVLAKRWGLSAADVRALKAEVAARQRLLGSAARGSREILSAADMADVEADIHAAAQATAPLDLSAMRELGSGAEGTAYTDGKMVAKVFKQDAQSTVMAMNPGLQRFREEIDDLVDNNNNLLAPALERPEFARRHPGVDFQVSRIEARSALAADGHGGSRLEVAVVEPFYPAYGAADPGGYRSLIDIVHRVKELGGRAAALTPAESAELGYLRRVQALVEPAFRDAFEIAKGLTKGKVDLAIPPAVDMNYTNVLVKAERGGRLSVIWRDPIVIQNQAAYRMLHSAR